MLALLFALLFALSYVTPGQGSRGCAPCQPSLCASLPAEGCPGGSVPDSCDCCSVCAAGQGEPCGGRGGAGRCAAGMECVKVAKSNKRKAGVCACKNAYEVCGSDGVTYTNDCELRAASIQAKNTKQAEITQLYKGLCERAPSVVTPPKEIWNVTGAQVYLSCEVIGIPTPVLTWKKVVETNKGVEKMELLPGDRYNLAIQTRGGPEKHEVTGWVLISPLSKNEAGGYECHALNSKGVAMASGRINVVDSLDEIPSSKSPVEEL